MKKLLIPITFLLLITKLFSSQDCTSSICNISPVKKYDTSATKFEVLSPIGFVAIEPIKQVQRLDSLDGKNIAIVGGSFMAHITHPELKRLILEKYPKAKVYVLNEVGSAGVFLPKVLKPENKQFQERLKEMKIDAVISGNGGCGLCTPKEMGSCIAAEYIGIPSVMIAASSFMRQSIITAKNAGVPEPRVARYPAAFTSHTKEELIKNTRDVLFPQIIDALTKPLLKNDSDAKKLSTSDIAFAGTIDEINLHFAENRWTDGLPIIPPTRRRVEEFLKYTDMPADAEIAVVSPSFRIITPRLVAINGVMAGCPPEFMPLLIAFTKAMVNGDFRRTLASTHGWTPYCWINGPIARQLGIDSAQGEISSQRNAVIGRFINLAMLNIAGYYVKENRMGTFGYLMPWCLAEDEESVLKLGWRPYHMQNGFKVNENILTAASSLTWGNNIAPATTNPKRIMELVAWDVVEKQQFGLGSGTPFVYRTILLTENVAKNLKKDYATKEDFEEALINTARRPLEERAYANYYANPGSSLETKYSLSRHTERINRIEGGEMTNTPAWLAWSGKEEVKTVPVMKEGKTAILITGDSARNKEMCLAGGGFASVKIELPKNWDSLVAKLGYKPLSSFYLNTNIPSITAKRFSNYDRNSRENSKVQQRKNQKKSYPSANSNGKRERRSR